MSLIFDDIHLREELSFRTNDIIETVKFLKRGRNLKKLNDGFIIRAPEDRLVDLTDPYKVSYYKNVQENLTVFLCTKYLVDKNLFNDTKDNIIKKFDLRSFKCSLLKGESLETEYRICGNDSRIKSFKKYYLTELLGTELRKKISQKSKELLSNNSSISFPKDCFDNKNIFCKNFYYEAKDTYTSLGYKFPERHEINFLKGIFKSIPLDYDIFTFMPSGCFKYIFDFINKYNYKKICLHDFHANIESTHSNFYPKKDLKNKRILIIDTSYSGQTINRAEEIYKKEGATTCKLALFPKSKIAIKGSNYCLVLNKLIKSSTIDINDDNWPINLYKSSLSRTNYHKNSGNSFLPNDVFISKNSELLLQPL